MSIFYKNILVFAWNEKNGKSEYFIKKPNSIDGRARFFLFLQEIHRKKRGIFCILTLFK